MMLAVVVLAGCGPVEVVDWAKVCADKARMDVIRRRKRDERMVEDAIIEIRDGKGSTTNVGGFNECGGAVKLRMGEDGRVFGVGNF
jgi:hypothetical protein